MQDWYDTHKSVNVTHHTNEMKDKNHRRPQVSPVLQALRGGCACVCAVYVTVPCVDFLSTTTIETQNSSITTKTSGDPLYSHTHSSLIVKISFLKYFIYLFIYRGEGKEKERERNIIVWLPLTRPLTGD